MAGDDDTKNCDGCGEPLPEEFQLASRIGEMLQGIDITLGIVAVCHILGRLCVQNNEANPVGIKIARDNAIAMIFANTNNDVHEAVVAEQLSDATPDKGHLN